MSHPEFFEPTFDEKEGLDKKGLLNYTRIR